MKITNAATAKTISVTVIGCSVSKSRYATSGAGRNRSEIRDTGTPMSSIASEASKTSLNRDSGDLDFAFFNVS